MQDGHVFLVGSGPGDPDLLTIKALKVLQAAQTVVFDRLVSAEILALVPAKARRIDVGKRAGHHPVPQDDINRLLVHLAGAGRVVVRLKGGDPYIFGRGSEEALALRRAGIGFTIVPGITSAQGCAASTRVPLTHRGLATGVRYITGHCRADQPLELDWAGLADPDTTLVVYMGLANMPGIAARLMREGLADETPVMAVCQATTPRERCVVTTLALVSDFARQTDFDGPVLFIIGRVVSLMPMIGSHFEEFRHALPRVPVHASHLLHA
jgi:uroporphyrin-III C-methyltransferase